MRTGTYGAVYAGAGQSVMCEKEENDVYGRCTREEDKEWYLQFVRPVQRQWPQRIPRSEGRTSCRMIKAILVVNGEAIAW